MLAVSRALTPYLVLGANRCRVGRMHDDALSAESYAGLCFAAIVVLLTT